MNEKNFAMYISAVAEARIATVRAVMRWLTLIDVVAVAYVAFFNTPVYGFLGLLLGISLNALVVVIVFGMGILPHFRYYFKLKDEPDESD